MCVWGYRAKRNISPLNAPRDIIKRYYLIHRAFVRTMRMNRFRILNTFLYWYKEIYFLRMHTADACFRHFEFTKIEADVLTGKGDIDYVPAITTWDCPFEFKHFFFLISIIRPYVTNRRPSTVQIPVSLVGKFMSHVLETSARKTIYIRI